MNVNYCAKLRLRHLHSERLPSTSSHQISLHPISHKSPFPNKIWILIWLYWVKCNKISNSFLHQQKINEKRQTACVVHVFYSAPCIIQFIFSSISVIRFFSLLHSFKSFVFWFVRMRFFFLPVFSLSPAQIHHNTKKQRTNNLEELSQA